MSTDTPYVIETLDGLVADTLFHGGRDQVVVAVRITPVYGQLELGLVATVVDEANARGFSLTRETPFRDEWLICVFSAYDEDVEDE